jgi:acetyl-CoA carboxylase biotin carboxyl carrier protein
MNPLNPDDIQDLKQLIEFLKENQVAEFELDRGDLKIRLKFEIPQASPAGLSDLAKLPARAQTGPAQASDPLATPAAAAPAMEPEDELHIVKSPMVGTFFGSPSAGSPPFVSPGDPVQVGQEICIIEAMKLMNPIESDATGEIVKCFVSNGQPIEYGQPLFSVRLG